MPPLLCEFSYVWTFSICLPVIVSLYVSWSIHLFVCVCIGHIWYLQQWPRLPLDIELVVAELTEAGAGGREPVLQAAPVDGPQGA